jgi:serine-type D-Ala-D-Ala carboxypeptidase
MGSSVQEQIEHLITKARATSLFTEAAYACGVVGDGHSEIISQDHHANSRVYDLASLTKALLTTGLTMRLVLAKGIDYKTATLKETFSDHAFFGFTPKLKDMGLRQLLRHEAGLVFWKNFYCAGTGNRFSTKDHIFHLLNDAIERASPKGESVYSDLTIIILGHLLEAEYSLSLESLWLTYIAEDLNLKLQEAPKPSWYFDPRDCVPTGYCGIRNRFLQGEVHDENTWAFGGFSGHSGLFGSVLQVRNWLQSFMESRLGHFFTNQCFSEAQLSENSPAALGWRTAKDPANKPFGRGFAFGHMGFTGTTFWYNPIQNSYAIILTNRVAIHRLSSMDAMRDFRNNTLALMQLHIDNVSRQ